MIALPELQSGFGRAVLGRGGDALAPHVVADGIDPLRRVQVYRHHLIATLTAALAATFPVVCRLVDERFFAYAASRFIDASPPNAPCLFEYGANFADFLETFPPSRSLPYLPDVARLEWAINAAFHAEDAPVLAAEELMRVGQSDYPRLVLRRHPATRLLTSRHPVDAIWRANQADAKGGEDITPGAQDCRVVVYRRGLEVEWRGLDASELAFLRWLGGGRPLHEAYEAATGAGPFDLPPTLAWLLAAGVFTDFAVG